MLGRKGTSWSRWGAKEGFPKDRRFELRLETRKRRREHACEGTGPQGRGPRSEHAGCLWDTGQKAQGRQVNEAGEWGAGRIRAKEPVLRILLRSEAKEEMKIFVQGDAVYPCTCLYENFIHLRQVTGELSWEVADWKAPGLFSLTPVLLR